MSNGPNRLTIDLSALRRNLGRVRRQIDSRTKIMGIVKSDAYGHGLIPVALTLEKEGVDCLGVAFLGEALALRGAGIEVPIVLLGGIQGREEGRQAVQYGLTPVISDFRVAEILDKEGSRWGKKIPVHVKIDTGMGRLGIPHTETGEFLKALCAFKNINIEALISHFSSADEPDSGFTREQIRHFGEAVFKGRALGLELPLNSLANSAGIMSYKDSHFNMVRPGIMLYGGLPSPDFRLRHPLEPVMKFSARVLQVRRFADNTPLSYGRTYHTRGRQEVAVISAGYGDGLPRCLSNRGWVLVRGRKVPIVGRICMNMLLCDVTEMGEVLPGDEVLFLGAEDNGVITGDDLALWGDTISYEIFCSLGRCSNRVYINERKTE